MQRQTRASRTARNTASVASGQSSAGTRALARKPPDYGIDFVDRQRINHLTAVAAPVPAADGGKRPGSRYLEGEAIGGRNVGEFFGDVARPAVTAVGNVVGSVAGALTGVDISSRSLVGPTWNNHGDFDWGVMFDVTGGQAGWVVQEVTNTYRAEDAAGHNVVPAHTPHYWEAWSVDAAGNIDPNFVDHRGCDDWIRPGLGANTEGHFSMRGKVHFTTANPAGAGFTPSGVGDAGGLLATAAAPANLDLGVARLHRYVQGHWDDIAAPPTAHTGSAR